MDIQTLTLTRDGKSDAQYIDELEEAVDKMSRQTEFFLNAMEISIEALMDISAAYEQSQDATMMYQVADLALNILGGEDDGSTH